MGRMSWACTPGVPEWQFDDGPEAGTTARALDALVRERVRASCFLLGRNALAHQTLARRELNEG